MAIREYEGVTRRQARLDVRPRWWAEILTILIFYELYSLVRNSQDATAAHAFRNAETLVDIEQAIRLYFEHGFQQLFLHSTQFLRFLNVYYGTAHFIVTAFVLGFLWWRYPSSYRDARWVLAATTGLALIGFVFYPVMPPRLMPHYASNYHYVDTLKTIGGLWNFDSGPIARLSNQYAAMPSLHFGVERLVRDLAVAATAELAPPGADRRPSGPHVHRHRRHREPLVDRRARGGHGPRDRLDPREVAGRTMAPAGRPLRRAPLGGDVLMHRPAGLDEIVKTVEFRLDVVLTVERDRWSAVDADLGRPFAALRRFVLAGGKRLRPAFCHWAFVGSGGDPTDPVITEAGCALELLQAFALIHDDVMDGSLTRRGLDAMHVDFDTEHRATGLRGESRRFGEGVAVLVGDLAFVLADQLLADAPAQAWEIWNELRLEVNVGQYLDVVHSARGAPSVEAARRINRYKTASYTIVRPLHLGAALAGADSPSVRTALADFGLPLGEAFQLVDDLLGTFGDAERTGKPVGDDLREGKPTRLVAEALTRADGDDLKLLRERFGEPDLTEEEIKALQQVLESTGAKAEVETAADELLATALEALERAPLSGEARAALVDLAKFVITRDY